MSGEQCSCCGALGISFPDCPNCYGCGPEGTFHGLRDEVWSQQREDGAFEALEYARAEFERIRAQRERVGRSQS